MLWGSQSKQEDSPEKPIPREKLPPQLQQLVDHDEGFYDDIYSSYSVDSTDTPYRYAGYANRLRTVLLSAHRYVAYTSDIGESFRPVAHPYLVRSAYAISWSYLIGDVAHEGYKAYLRNRRVLAPPGEAYKDAKGLTQDQVFKGMATGNVGGSLRSPTGESDSLEPWPTTQIPLIEDYRTVMAKRAVFQSIASMGLPALTIHSVVKYSGRALNNSKSVWFRTWAPIGLGLSVVPFLPYIFDEPVDEAVEWSFRTAIRAYAGEDAIRSLPKTADTDANASTAALPTHSWEEHKEERRRAKEERKKELEERGQKGPFALLGLGGNEDSKKKTE
ncbi:mitochondrial 18 KDa protein-domain-containing protein [Aspergillus pseudotamarii]|uniref:Mitochondrial fission process protein 1 n=1 Tax=Aspergillus pseudotamarii TaxID=132259 RepID=A0A5N6SBB5_ASPPS|nr:mitochondrial 18 KDa protein-domain-containing protein [Aspergillus pseudotamarii]KAE8131237.1 mitochondrial 18 KDa protein-domain-containing protein [Aspergillus pseudotamarii]